MLSLTYGLFEVNTRGPSNDKEPIRAVQPAGGLWPTDMREGRSPEESAQECYSAEHRGEHCEHYRGCHRFQESEPDVHQPDAVLADLRATFYLSGGC